MKSRFIYHQNIIVISKNYVTVLPLSQHELLSSINSSNLGHKSTSVLKCYVTIKVKVMTYLHRQRHSYKIIHNPPLEGNGWSPPRSGSYVPGEDTIPNVRESG